MKRLIYLAYPIDNAMMTDKQIQRIAKAKHDLLSNDVAPAAVVFDPGDAFLVRHGSDPGPEISSINNHALGTADGVLAFMPKGISSVGVPMEVALAGMRGVPVAIVSDAYSWSLQLPVSNVMVFPEEHEDVAIEWLLNFETDVDLNTNDILPYVGDPWHGPTRAYSDDAGLDLRVSEETTLEWGVFKDVPLGINVALPEWSWGFLVGRSSTFRKRGIEVMPGIIDTGYRGQLFAACIWRPDDIPVDPDTTINGKPTYTLDAGDRIAQLIVIPNGTRDVTPKQVAALPEHERGENGFGSSGA